MKASGSSSMGSSDIVHGEPDEFTCIICTERPRASIVTSCGHLFCWSCLYKWKKDNQVKPCPMCKIMLRFDNIIPIYEGCENGSSSSKSKAPSAPSQSTGSGDHDTSRQPSLQGPSDRHLRFLRSRAQAEFRAICALHWPSSPAWTDEAFDSFDPPMLRFGDLLHGPLDDNDFVFNVSDPMYLALMPALMGSFQSYWLAYYAALNPETPEPEPYYHAFLEAWCLHFHQVWYRAGCPSVSTSHGSESHLNTTGPEGDSSSLIVRDVFMCSICKDRPRDSVVVSECGHLFCWSCLYGSSIQFDQENSACPLCKIKFGNGNIIPIYGISGSSRASTHGSMIPPRPSAPLGAHIDDTGSL